MSKKLLSLMSATTLLASVFWLGAGVITSANANENVTTPDGFDYVLLYMGTGIVDPSNSEPRPGVTGCVGLFCDGDFFQKQIMGRTDAEVEALRMEAKQFYLDRFGIDVDDPAMENRVSFDMFTLDPDFEYRLQVASGMRAPSEGWIIRDGGFRLQVIDPNGIDLGGEHAGAQADFGNAMFFGNYNILVTDNGQPVDELTIFYRSRIPAVVKDGRMTFICDMFHEEWGPGIGMGTLTLINLEDGTIRGNARNVLTFPPASDMTEFPENPPYDAHP